MSTETKAVQHTPGPWRRDGSQLSGDYHTAYIVGGIYGEHPTIFVSSYCYNAAELAQFEANVDFIAAAPDMLEALRTISDRDPCNQTDGIVGDCLLNPPCIGCIARAAIRKAEGEL